MKERKRSPNLRTFSGTRIVCLTSYKQGIPTDGARVYGLSGDHNQVLPRL